MDLAAAVFSTLILLVGFWLLVARQIRAAVDGYAIQSILLGCLALALFGATRDPDLLALGILTIAIKGVAIPAVIERQAKTTYGKRELQYHVGFPTALLVGAGLTLIGFVAAARLPYHPALLAEPVFGVAIAVTLLGFFTAMARRDAVLQLAGLLVAENGVILVGLVVASGLGLLIEFAVFLDVLVGVAVMGFLIARMHETVSSTDTSELSRLRG
jgi:hydrogenase-4 membrane subunit HyfE